MGLAVIATCFPDRRRTSCWRSLCSTCRRMSNLQSWRWPAKSCSTAVLIPSLNWASTSPRNPKTIKQLEPFDHEAGLAAATETSHLPSSCSGSNNRALQLPVFSCVPRRSGYANWKTQHGQICHLSSCLALHSFYILEQPRHRFAMPAGCARASGDG